MARKTKFQIRGTPPSWYVGPMGTTGYRGIRNELLLSMGEPQVEEAIVAMVNAVKPAGTEVFVSHTFGPKGRVVVHLFDRTVKKRASERTAARQALQQALNRIGGRFRKGGGRKL